MPTVDLSGSASGVSSVRAALSPSLVIRGPLNTYLRNLLDDAITADNGVGFWSDAELTEALERERRTVQPFMAGEGMYFGAYGLGSYGSAWIGTPSTWDLARLHPGSILAAGPGFTRYQARETAYRFWAASPAPIIHVNGQEATAAGYSYTLDLLSGAVTFTAFPNGASSLAVDDVVYAAFDRYDVYEASYTLVNVAIKQWAAVIQVSKNGIQVSRAKLTDTMAIIQDLRRKGKPKHRPRYARMS